MAEQSDEEIKEHANRPRQSRISRYIIGPWIRFGFEKFLIEDIYNYQAEVREDIFLILSEEFNKLKEISKNHLETVVCLCISCIIERLKVLLLLSDEGIVPQDEVEPNIVLPRYLWYKSELIRLFGKENVIEEIAIDNESDDDLVDEEIEETSITMLPNETSQDEKKELEAEQIAISANNIETVMFKSTHNDRKFINLIRVDTPIEEEAVLNQKVKQEPMGTLELAIKDIQSRLAKHGVLADPRTYKCAKGRDEMYDADDPWLDDANDLADALLHDALDSANEDLTDTINDDSEDSIIEELYINNEHLFVFDNFSEEEEEIIKRTENGQRVIKTYEWQKPSTLQNIYNPKAWAHSNRKAQLPALIQIFFKVLEYTLPGKKVQILQKQIYDKYEWVTVNEQTKTISLNEDAENAIAKLVYELILSAYSTFLWSFCNFKIEHCPAVELPTFLKYLRLTDQESPFYYGFVPPDSEYPSIIYQILTKVVTPYTPPESDCNRWYWLAVAEHTIRTFFAIEDRIFSLLKSQKNEVDEQLDNSSNNFRTEGKDDFSLVPPDKIRKIDDEFQADKNNHLVEQSTAVECNDQTNIMYKPYEEISSIHYYNENMGQSSDHNILMSSDDDINDKIQISSNEGEKIDQSNRNYLLTAKASMKQINDKESIRGLNTNRTGMMLDNNDGETNLEYSTQIEQKNTDDKLDLIHELSESMHKSNKELANVQDTNNSESYKDKNLCYLPIFNTVKEAATVYLRAINIRKRIAEILYKENFKNLALALTIMQSQIELLDKDINEISDDQIKAIINTPSMNYVYEKFSDNSNFVNTCVSILSSSEYNQYEQEEIREKINLDLNIKRKREENNADVSLIGTNKLKRFKERNIIAELFTNLNDRLVDSIQACPYELPINFGVAVTYENNSYVIVSALYSWQDFNNVDIGPLYIDQPINNVELDVKLRFKNIISYFDHLTSLDFVVEGRTRSMVYTGFDNRIKYYCLAILPLNLKNLKVVNERLTYTDFLKSSQYSLKSRLSLLDVIMVLLYIHHSSSGMLKLKYLFSNNVTVNEDQTFYVENDIKRSINFCLNEPIDIWQKTLDRFLLGQFNWIKIYQSHYELVNNYIER